ncbi:hypothetical protein, partial [Klebsiella pneumoniae]
MTITLQAVNELIASLESAGELSIREQKFLKLAKEFRICSASLDAAIKTGNVLADQNAQLAAENVALKESRNNLAEFIHEELDADYPLNMNLETHATDRIVAGIKADGVEEFAAKLRIPGDDQFFDALAKGVAL